MSSVHLFQYDIPEVKATNKRTGEEYSRPVMPNPSARLWRAGAVRLTDSCWLVHEGAIPLSLVRDFRQKGVKWKSAPFDPSASAALAEMALDSIRKEVEDYVTRARETQAKAEAWIAEKNFAKGSPEAAKAHKKYRALARSIKRRVAKRLEMVSAASERFDIAPEQYGAPSALKSVDAVTETMELRALTFAKAHDVIVKKRGKGDHVAGAIAADAIFAPVAADYLDDFGDAEASRVAKKLRGAFGYDF